MGQANDIEFCAFGLRLLCFECHAAKLMFESVMAEMQGSTIMKSKLTSKLHMIEVLCWRLVCLLLNCYDEQATRITIKATRLLR